MHSIGVVRKVDRLGRFAIPAELRKALDISPKDPLEISFDSHNTLTLKKYSPGTTCQITGKTDDDNLILAKYNLVLSREGAEMVMREIKRYLLEHLKDELERISTTSASVYNANKKAGEPHSSTVCRRFNMTFSEIVKLLGLKPSKAFLPKDEMLEQLTIEFNRIGSYKKNDYEKKRNKALFPYPRVLTAHLDMTWNDIIKACGCEKIRRYKIDEVSDQVLIHEYKQISDQLNHPATVRELQQLTAFSYDIYRQHFGTITELRRQCDFKIADKVDLHAITKAECQKQLLNIYKKHGRLSYSELKKRMDISMSTLFRKFNTTKINDIWNEVTGINF
ncbi:bifunctional DNA-binding transcriptional regulator/antitoxin component of YhaV-PrlF toxin-antitoxin module [Scopulibacillus darangshiensis]|uniref:Bifunctional DNA-binding transcriptional regulator/antitoxin component of YhaV-PrlF toxin-antitoxin module n=1 Tax=Scopulibacillus darangshiensis TaxID=442528 RepID=A0A4R2NRQ0_9BACL|nr:bifunctional DNA-binding transcriptional regulator/antitoxin component of YhaV-PrlF toxin-antitoxin module [Scopulibacillus darangshiensis]